ncbi:alpha-2-macroglobulin family protein [Hymenobacter fodinae]|uniref:Alpha-2-macroglobulin domain-containing protein n=1 Tax=Hymenobacter fodinae TaxID=2510796 RepID=A0A4Z0PEV9_9BACT|nr:MG2 domain-containing protein [Hymenobacter fodinae]TGE10199.1 hypothetical protein EU556_05085 [Hymenobacter fodinae]
MRAFLFSLLLLLMLFSSGSSQTTPASGGGSNPATWKKIDQLLANDQTTSAAKLLEPLYQAARKRQDTPEYLRALLYKLRLLDAREEDSNEKAIALVEADLKTATFPARPILHSLLGQLYAQYYQQHRYQLHDRTRTATSSAPDYSATDIQTWDAARLGSAIVQHYQASLMEAPQRQQQMKLSALGYAVRGGDAEGRALRPTLYDLLGHRAVEALRNEEYYVARPLDQFELNRAAYFSPAAEFARLPLEAPRADSLNGRFFALQALQQLTQFRLTDAKNQAALADLELQRLRFVKQYTVLVTADSLYRQALSRAAETYAALPISTSFIWEEAVSWEYNRPAKALELALRAEKRFPTSQGAKQAAALRQRIETKELNFTTEEVLLPNQPWLLQLRVRNITKLYAKAYRIPVAQAVRQLERGGLTDGIAADFRKRYARILATAPAANWTLNVPGAQDYKSHMVQHAGPALALGHYVVVLSTMPDAPGTEQTGEATYFNHVSVSELSHVHRSSATKQQEEVLVLNRRTGQPVVGVQVVPYWQSFNEKNNMTVGRPGPAVTTDAGGLGQVALPADENSALLRLLLTRGADSLLDHTNRTYNPASSRINWQTIKTGTFLYTDRAIYRPGQTVYFKGIVTEKKDGKAVLQAGKPVSIRLLDVNRKIVETLTFTTSEFGSFHGSFVLPTGLLNGQMSLQTDAGSLYFSVEDYKRPSFQVVLEPVAGTPTLGQHVTVHGTATAYAGQPVDGAIVQFRVRRFSVRPLLGSNGGITDMEVLSGTTQTDAAGKFTITFLAKDDGSKAEKRRFGLPENCYFIVYADVTDAAGETRSGEQNITVGETLLSVQLQIPVLINREKVEGVSLAVTNATGTPVPSRATLRLYRLTPPAQATRPRLWERPEREGLPQEEFKRQFPLDAYGPEDVDSTWARTLVATQEYNTEAADKQSGLAALLQQQPGRYVLEATLATTGAQREKAERYFTLFSATTKELPVPTPHWFVSLQDSVVPGKAARFLVGSSAQASQLLFEAEAKGQLLYRERVQVPAGQQRIIEVPTTASLDGAALTAYVTHVQDNRLYTNQASVKVSLPPAPLRLSIATFRDKLLPGQRETWRVTVHQANGKPAQAELLATLYDASLDAFQVHSFMPLTFPWNPGTTLLGWQGAFRLEGAQEIWMRRPRFAVTTDREYPHLNMWGYKGEDLLPGQQPMYKAVEEIVETKPYTNTRVTLRGTRSITGSVAAAPAPMMADAQQLNETVGTGAAAAAPARPDLSGVQARTDFRETAFWMPALRTDARGEMVLEFQMPEAVTRWQLLTLAHDQQLHSGMLARTLVTQKQLQVTTNAPRFFREGDQLRFTAKLSNLTAQPLSGTAQLFLLDARTQQPLEGQLLKSANQVAFELKANQSTGLGWELSIPEIALGQVPLEAVTYRVVAQASTLPASTAPTSGKEKRQQRRQNKHTNGSSQLTTVSDGEENTLPVLPNRVLITESLPLPIVGPATREFELKKLISTPSATRRNYSLTLEMTQNPAWYAVQALPYLTEYPYECSEQVFSRLYANLLAAKILQSNPRFKTMLAEWNRAAQAGDKVALTSKLEQNQELKSLLLQETPWVREAQTDTERMRRLVTLFDEPRLQSETARDLTKLAKMQQPNGAFPWFERMPEDRYITQLIVAGFGKLNKLGAFNPNSNSEAREILRRALLYLDGQLERDYTVLRKQSNGNGKQNNVSVLQVQALYARSFWLEQPVSKAAQSALTYYQQQVAAHWQGQTRYLQAQIALGLHRYKVQPATVRNIMLALTENALHSAELGMYWKEVRGGYYWQDAPTETQATLIETYDEVQNDQKSVDEMKLWLLKQKQTQNWECTRATADACYALLLRGSDWLQPTQPITVTVGGKAVVPTSQQAGTGYFKTNWLATEITPDQGRVTVTKPDAGVAWGALYWQYFEQIDKVTPATTSLALERQLYREQRTTGGPVLEPITPATPLRVGDVLVVRLVLRSDRALEYVHLKDQRAAGLELIGQTSGYRYQGGLGYYESPRDAATNFFMSYFPKGTHTFEYRLRAAQSGNFSGGLSQLQCLYAPEFSAHSAGTRLQIAPQP